MKLYLMKISYLIILFQNVLGNLSIVKNEDHISILWPNSLKECMIRVDAKDIMNKTFRIQKKLKVTMVNIPTNILMPGEINTACLLCPRRVNLANPSICENFVIKPLPIAHARCQAEENKITFSFEPPIEGNYDSFEVKIDPAEEFFHPRILSKNMHSITFNNLKAGKAYKISARTFIGHGNSEDHYSEAVELICNTKCPVAETPNHLGNQKIYNEEMALMIQSQTAVMRMLILLTVVMIMIMLMSIYIFHSVMKLKYQLGDSYKQTYNCEEAIVSQNVSLVEGINLIVLKLRLKFFSHPHNKFSYRDAEEQNDQA